MYISDMMWQCIQLGDVNEAMLLHGPLQKSQEILGTKFGDENINISDMMWQCNQGGDGGLGDDITSPTPKIV